MLAAAIGTPSESAPPPVEPDPDDPLEWARRQLSWERRLDALRETAMVRAAGRLRSASIQAPNE